MAGLRFVKPVSKVDLSSKVRHDPFAKLPYSVICRISFLIYDTTVPDFATASWAVHSATRSKTSFWKSSLQHNMAWFFEIQELMRLGALRRPEMFKGIFLWANKKIWVSNGLKGPLMYVANRRRIWSICEDLGSTYQVGNKQR
ncbi:hypothetical protein F5Y13DRAFT_150420 [Hypoxylon sp. FL1857]|nr:hypothetical protein F5Y13DRAFT_150420 [Hypoxylon sp. FL1857]